MFKPPDTYIPNLSKKVTRKKAIHCKFFGILSEFKWNNTNVYDRFVVARSISFCWNYHTDFTNLSRVFCYHSSRIARVVCKLSWVWLPFIKEWSMLIVQLNTRCLRNIRDLNYQNMVDLKALTRSSTRLQGWKRALTTLCSYNRQGHYANRQKNHGHHYCHD